MPILPIDTNRELKIESPLGDDLILHAFSGEEKLGRLYSYNLDLRSPNPNIEFKDIVGQRVTVCLELSQGERFFDGFVSEFQFTEANGQFASYKATLKPWFWLLTRTADCRVFQNQKVPDIIKAVFRDNGMSEFKDLMGAAYREWVYCVQYRETDFEFVSRLMEQEGIYYYFEHERGKHTLVLTDGKGGHQTYPDYETVPFFPPDLDARRKRDHIDHWSVKQGIVPGKHAIKAFDFEKPKVDLTSRVKKSRPHAYPLEDHEIFDYPGEYNKFDEGNAYVDIQMQEHQAQHEQVRASGTAMGMCAGCLFELENYPRKDQNKEYLIVAVSHEVRSDAFETERKVDKEEFYRFQMEAISSSQQYRSQRITPKPIVQGPQTAIVVGPADEEIYCDKYGRVKVQFHWDRYGKSDQNSSCWVRVSQAWAGKSWGSIHIPRIGQEVLVSFLEGDPDRPLISGRVYNASQMPPYTLEKNKTQSGIKSRSSDGGTSDNFNEIRMEDKKGSEELYIQAEKNEKILVKNNKSETVGANETISIGNDRKESVGKDETLEIAGNRNVSVGANQDIQVAANETKNVSSNWTVTVGANHNQTISANQEINVGSVRSVTVGGDANLTVGGSYAINAAAPITITSGATITLTAGGSKIEIGPQGVTIQTGGIVNVMGSLIKLN